ncbi:MAG: phospholipase A [Campylobacterota bacterium]|nr:phospholipase A [Campylobacterota bacterium]
MKKIIISCLLGLNLFASDSTFVDDLLLEVTDTLDSNLTQKIKLENVKNYIKSIKLDDKVDKKRYKLNVMGHYENYMLLGGYSPNNLTEKKWKDGIRTSDGEYERDSNEAQFQLSIKVPLYANFLNSGADLFSAYTQNSYWQVYNTDKSSPFRETNYMPELFMEWHPDKKFGDSTLTKARFALIHQSNGQDVGQSRSWNRTELFFLFQNQNIFYGLNIWDRWDEETKKDIAAIEGDDNPELEDLVGNQKYFVKYKGESINLMLSHQNDILEYNINKGNTKLDITFPSINSNFDFFIRVFDGYGESLVDYDIKIQRVSFGIMLSDWI